MKHTQRISEPAFYSRTYNNACAKIHLGKKVDCARIHHAKSPVRVTVAHLLWGEAVVFLAIPLERVTR